MPSPASELVDRSPTDSRPLRRDLSPLTGLRFFAALQVLLFHAYGTWSGATLFDLPYPLTNFFTSGYVGVSLFFVLSGFILDYTYMDADLTTPDTRRAFWLSRFARIYPVYALGLLLAAPKFLHGLTPVESISHGATTALTAVSVATLTQAWSPVTALGWLPPGWSLSAEAFFYLLFPLLASRLRLRSGPQVMTMIGLCWLLTLAAPTLYYLLTPASPLWANVVKFNPLIRLPEFLIGIGIGRLFLLRHSPEIPTPAARGLLQHPFPPAALIVTALAFHHLVPKIYMHNGLIVPLFGWLIFNLARPANSTTGISRLLSTPTLLLLGQASYAIYILHIPLKGLMTFAIERIIDITSPLAASAFFLAYFAATLTASILTLRWIETPVRGWIRHRFGRQPELKVKPGLTAVERCRPGDTPQPAVPARS